MKKISVILLMWFLLIISGNVWAEDKTVIIKVRINKLSQEQADQIPAKVNEIFKGSCKVEVESKPVPPKGKSWKYNEMTNLFPEPETIILPHHHGDHVDRGVSHPSYKPSVPQSSNPKPSSHKDGKCHHKHKDKNGHQGKNNHNCSDGDKNGNNGKHDRGDKKGHDGKGKCGRGDKSGHGNNGKGSGHCGGHGKGR